jgi:hypothetical protein
MRRPALPAYSGALKPPRQRSPKCSRPQAIARLLGKWHVSNTLERPDHMKDLNRERFPECLLPD